MNSIFYPLKTKFLGACIDLVRSWYGEGTEQVLSPLN